MKNKKSMMKNKKMLMLLLTILFSVFVNKVDAAATKVWQRPVELENGTKNVVKAYDTASKPNKLGDSRTMYLWVEFEDGTKIVAYCLDFGTPLGISSSFGDHSGNIVKTTSLNDFLATKINDASERAKIIEQLNYYYYFGYKEGDGTRGKPEWFLATQAMMWQYLGDRGFYLNSSKGQVEDIMSEEEYAAVIAGRTPEEGTRVNVKPLNIRFMKYDSSIPSHGLSSVLTYNENDIVNISTARSSINNSIQKYKTLPSVCDYDGEMKANSTLTLTDTNNVLSKYTASCNGIQCQISGDNKITIKSGDTTGEVTISLERQEGNNYESNVYQMLAQNSTSFTGTELGQGVGVIGGKLPKMSCTLKVKVVKSACYICGTDYVWTDNPSDSCELQEEIIEQASCAKPEPEPEQCYVCTNGNHTWGTNNPDPDNCNPDPDIAKPNCVTTPQTSGLRIAYISLICGLAAAIAFVYFYSKKQTDK